MMERWKDAARSEFADCYNRRKRSFFDCLTKNVTYPVRHVINILSSHRDLPLIEENKESISGRYDTRVSLTEQTVPCMHTENSRACSIFLNAFIHKKSNPIATNASLNPKQNGPGHPT